jgi:hypothetical protein
MREAPFFVGTFIAHEPPHLLPKQLLGAYRNESFHGLVYLPYAHIFFKNMLLYVRAQTTDQIKSNAGTGITDFRR